MKDTAQTPRGVRAPLPHDSAPLHVTGAARYVDDIPVPEGTLHLAFALSPVASGVLRGVDVSGAGDAALVWTARDAKGVDTSPSLHDEPLLADGEVRFMGQPLALVAAASHHEARRQARQVRPEIDERPPILSVDDALTAGDRHFDGGPRVWTDGDPDAALAAAPHVVEGLLEVGGQEHFYLEGQAALALPQEDGSVVVHSSSQHPTEIQHKVADALGLPMALVRVEVRRMGGGFGGKESQGNALAVACALVAARTGRAAKMRYDRDDDFVVTGKRHGFRIGYRAGFSPEGDILGMDVTHWVSCGWSQDLSLPVADRAMLHAANCYDVPAVRLTSHRLRTDIQSATAFRGFGGPQGMLGMERIMDHAAHALGLDPVEIRRRNYFPDHDAAAPHAEAEGIEVPDGTDTDMAGRGAVGHVEGRAPHIPPEGPATHYGMPVRDFALGGITERLLETSDYRARAAAIADWNAAQPVLRRGIAFSPVQFGISFTLTHLNQAGALVHVYQDGSIAVNHGGTEMGQGLFRKVAQVVASRFGVDASHVRPTATDTGKVPNTSATAASSGSDLNSMAAMNAADAIRGRIAGFLGALHDVPADLVRFEGGLVAAGPHAIPWAEAVRLAYVNRVSLSASGFYKTPDIVWDREKGRGRPFFYFAYGAAVTEVVLDRLTGESRILRADILHDAGASLNPALDRGQIEGGFVQGAGWLTTEELVWDAKGRLSTHAPSTYKIPAASDAPPAFDVRFWDRPNPERTVYRSKAVGEPPLMLGISAWLALGRAAAAFGDRWPDLSAPATAEALYWAAKRAAG
ncbi:xanthine dehydrogenase molybdenum binding subunit apoprotein [Hasllibacter halocynthiae]|uniref:Xanthine dehydrogenase molybdenum binding subunit apoprotein n=1 Tax=Hasllibacter halocynthiae TaxID=595589 RepID=A0A2T0X128_9RHOB|nr:xanthine dehydrogenase molybdopterin binding subunit [Hasllibacter halocynthiae]PRY92640.1 xanthine dehydrogenase molybdenum binding subunit apoprotein [Hasllibacter halocynthiae]